MYDFLSILEYLYLKEIFKGLGKAQKISRWAELYTNMMFAISWQRHNNTYLYRVSYIITLCDSASQSNDICLEFILCIWIEPASTMSCVVTCVCLVFYFRICRCTMCQFKRREIGDTLVHTILNNWSAMRYFVFSLTELYVLMLLLITNVIYGIAI